MNVRTLVLVSLLVPASAGLVVGQSAGKSNADDAARTPVLIKVRVVESSAAAARANAKFEDLVKAGGKIISDPAIRDLSDMPAKVSVSQDVTYTVRTGDKASPTREAKVTVGMELGAIPRVNADGSIQLELDMLDSEPGPGGVPEVNKQGFFNSVLVKGGSMVRFGSWTIGGKVRTVFAAAVVVDSDSDVKP